MHTLKFFSFTNDQFQIYTLTGSTEIMNKVSEHAWQAFKLSTDQTVCTQIWIRKYGIYLRGNAK